MTADPGLRFLGVALRSDPAELLGLAEAAPDRAAIEAALRARLDGISRHPAGRGPEAEAVRVALRGAAKALTDRAIAEARRRATGALPPRRPPLGRARTPQQHELTDFDRRALAALVACGGWNARSRAMLVALAAGHGLAADGLLLVVRGLARYAREGGSHLEVEDLAGGAAELGAAMPRPVAPSRSSLAHRLVPEARDASTGTTIKLSIAFALLTLLFGGMLMRAILRSPQRPVPVPVPPVVIDAPPPAPAGEEREDEASRAAIFRTFPGFRGNAVPIETSAAADRCAELPERLDRIRARVRLEPDPVEAVFRDWDDAIETIATGWTLAEPSVATLVRERVREVLHETADAPSAGDRLMRSLAPSSSRPADPADVFRGAWRAGTLGAIADSTTLPPAIVDRARSMLAVALGAERGAVRLSERAAAEAWLDRAAGQLLATLEYDERGLDFWECWIAAQRTLGAGERLQRAIGGAIATVLRSDADLGRAGPTQDLLGRLVTLAELRRSPALRDAMLALFEDELIEARDLWVLTSLLARSDAAPWFDAGLVLPADGGPMFRRRLRDRIAAAWPEVARELDPAAKGRSIAVDQESLDRWRGVLHRVHDGVAPSDVLLLARRVAAAGELNRAALHLASLDAASAESALAHAESLLLPPPPGTGPSASAMMARRAPGVDGEWARELDSARRDAETRRELLGGLAARGGGDLGPIDAEAFVDLVYRGAPREVRDQARSLAADHFREGPVVALEMLDRFPDASPSDELGEVIGRFTGELLPDPRHGSWTIAARRALVRHAIELRGAGLAEIDAVARELATILDDRTLLVVRSEGIERSPGDDPVVAAARLVEAWRRRADAVVAVRTVPDDLGGLRRRREIRRRLAEGPIQGLAAELCGVLDLVAYVAAAEQPEVAEVIEAFLAESSRRREVADHVLQQVGEAEQAISRIWLLRFGVTDTTPLPPVGPPLGVTRTAESEAAPTAPAAPGGATPSGRDPRRNPDRPPGILPPGPGEADPGPHDPRRSPPGTRPPAGPPPSASVVLRARLVAALARVPGDAAERFLERLEELDPNRPRGYFELGEEIADAAEDGGDRALAEHLFALAAVIDPAALGASGCLALADLAEPGPRRRRLLALAGLLGGDTLLGPSWTSAEQVSPATALAIGTAFSLHRRGDGPKAIDVLGDAGAMPLLETLLADLPGGSRRFLADCAIYKGQVRPALPESSLAAMLRLEQALLAGDDRPFSADLRLLGGRPLIEVDPVRLAETLGVDGRRSLWRRGRWTDPSAAR